MAQPAAMKPKTTILVPMVGTTFMSEAYWLIVLRKMVHMPAEMVAAMKVQRPERRAKKAMGMEESLL